MAVLDTPRSRNRRILSSLPSSRETLSEPLRAAELPARGLGPGEALASTLGIRSRSTSANSAKSVIMTLVWMSRLPSTRIFSLSATLSRYRVFLHESGRYPHQQRGRAVSKSGASGRPPSTITGCPGARTAAGCAARARLPRTSARRTRRCTSMRRPAPGRYWTIFGRLPGTST